MPQLPGSYNIKTGNSRVDLKWKIYILKGFRMLLISSYNYAFKMIFCIIERLLMFYLTSK